MPIIKIKEKLISCRFCQQQFYSQDLCPPCQKRDIHWGKKAPSGACQQCLEKGLKLIKEFNDNYYCLACLGWNEETDNQGIGTYSWRFIQTYCDNCGECGSCQRRKGLIGYSARDLMIEVHQRAEFEALLSWEDDDFKRRYGEIMWELEEVENLTPKKIRELVADDVIRKKLSQRKFSRGS